MPDERRTEALGAVGEDDELPLSAAAAPADPSLGRVLAGRYRLLDRLGSGAMADVYRAHDETLDRDVAIKLFRAVMEGGNTAGDARRELELQALAQLSHPNLITLFDGSVTDEGPSFLALELVEGPTLAAVLRDGALPEPQVRRIGEQIADALAYVHERGMVHRDVKPANILLGRDSATDPTSFRARLSDFGIVRLVDSAQVTAADLTVGTAYYLAPEQARSAAVGPPADVYALGLLLLESLTGTRPFEGPMHEVLVARLNRDPHIPADLPEPWPGLLRAMTAQDPAARPSAAAVAQVLRESGATGTGLPLSSAAAGAAGFGAAGFGAAGMGMAAGAAGLAAVGSAGAAGSGPGASRPIGGPATGPATGPAAFLPAAAPLAAAATTAVPRAAAAPGAPSRPPGDRGPHDVAAGEPPARHHMTGMLVAAAVFLLIIGGASWLVFKPTAGNAGPGQGQLGTNAGTSQSTSSRPSSSPVSRNHHQAVPVDEQSSVVPGQGAGPRHHARQSSGASQPSRSARSSSSAPPSTSSAPPSTSSAPPSTSSAPPSTSSAPPSTSSAPPSTSSAPPSTTSTGPSSAPTGGSPSRSTAAGTPTATTLAGPTGAPSSSSAA